MKQQANLYLVEKFLNVAASHFCIKKKKYQIIVQSLQINQL